jgi:hypothetical protein
VEFETFCASITSPTVKVVARHWNAARGAQPLPSWDQIKAADLVKQLPIVWSYNFDRTVGQFRGHLAGERISQIFGKNFRGISLEEVHPAESVEWIKAIFMRVVREPAVYRSAGRVFKQLDRYGVGERIILPLATDGFTGDGLLGVTDYDLFQQPGTALPPLSVFAEAEEWFSLSASVT